MAGEIIQPRSPVIATSGKIFDWVLVGQTNSRQEGGYGVMASLDGDATLEVVFDIPTSVPSGTAKLKCKARANATSGAAKLNPKWFSCAAEENPDTLTLNAEGTSTITWAAGDVDVVKELDITMDADTFVVDETVYVHIVFETSSWTLAQISLWNFYLFWE